MAGRYVNQIELQANVEKALKNIAELQKKADKLENKEYKISLGVDSQKLENVISNLEKMLNSLSKGTGDFKQFENLSKELSGIVSEVQSLSKAFGKVDDSGAKTLLSSIQSIDKSLSDLSQNILNVNKNMDNMGGNTSSAVKQVENIGNAYQNAAKEAEKLADAQGKIGNKTNISSGNVNQKKDTFQDKDISASAEVITNALKEENSALEQNTQKVKENTQAKEQNKSVDLSKYDKRLEKYDGNISKYNAKIDNFKKDGWTSPEYLENVQAVERLVEKYRDLLGDIKTNQNGIATDKDIANLDKYEKKIKDATSAVTNMSAAQKGYNFVSGQKELDKIHKLLKDNSAMSQKAKAQIKEYYRQIASGNPSASLDVIHGKILEIVNAEIEAGRGGKRFLDAIKEKAWFGAAGVIGTYFGVDDAINLGKEGLSVVRELNTALTEMRKVSDESLQSLKNYQNTTFDVANAVGTTAKQIQTSTADYMRLGESLDEAAESAKTANILLNVSEFDNIEDATKSLVAMGQAYKDLDKMTIVDKLNEVGNNYAISTDELATALQKSAATLSLMGNTIDEAASLVTTANATIQDADSVSAGIRTISLRVVGTEEAEEELSAMNEEVDAFVKATKSKKQQIIKDYTAVASNKYQGFDILNSNGNYKNTYEILLGIAKIYKEIQEQDKKLGTNHATALIEELAGKNRSNIASAILQDPTQLEAVKKSSEEAMGSAENELNSYLDSIDGRQICHVA